MKYSKNKHAVKKQKGLGQSMLEAIIAIGILTTAISSALTLTQSSIKGEKESEAGIIAGNLAREAVEVIRARRDTNWLEGREWSAGFDATGSDYTAVPEFDPVANVWNLNFVPNSIDDSGTNVYIQTAESADGFAVFGLFRQAAVQPDRTIRTVFKRLITLDRICFDGGERRYAISGSDCGSPDNTIGIVVFVDVQFAVSGRVRHYEVVEEMYNWK